MRFLRAALICVVGFISMSCSEKPPLDRHTDSTGSETTPEPSRESSLVGAGESELQPPEDEIGEDCVAFVRATTVVPAQAAGADCPACPAEGTEVLAFREMKIDRVFCSSGTCEVAVTIRCAFNPGAGERFAGGLTAWIPPEQQSDYLRGHVPTGDQTYRVKITYKRTGEAWRAIEFDRADPE